MRVRFGVAHHQCAFNQSCGRNCAWDSPSFLFTVGMSLSLFLPLPVVLSLYLHFSLHTSQIWMVLLCMSWLMKDPSSVINIFPGPRSIGGFNYHSGAHLLFTWHAPAKWSLYLQHYALVHINYAGGTNYIFMHSNNYIFNTADVSIIYSS